jgi:uncharacterized protein YecA (UPF0149 family)
LGACGRGWDHGGALLKRLTPQAEKILSLPLGALRRCVQVTGCMTALHCCEYRVANELFALRCVATPVSGNERDAKTAGASVYQLGSFGTARKELKALTLSP